MIRRGFLGLLGVWEWAAMVGGWRGLQRQGCLLKGRGFGGRAVGQSKAGRSRKGPKI